MSTRPPAIRRASSLPQGAFIIKTRARTEAWSKKAHSYKSLPTRLRHDGFDYCQIARGRDAAIYEQTWSGCSDPSVCYEVIRIRRREGFEIDGRLVEPAEAYPSSAAWGVNGWTVQDKESAFHKVREILNALQKESANPVKKSPILNTKRCPESIELRGDVKNRRDGQ